VTANYFGQSFESFKTIAVLMALILTNNKLLIGIKDIRTITGRIYKGTESNRSNNIIDFGSNSKESHVVHSFKKYNIKDQKYQVKSFELITIVL
jgi:hypothetical protein